MPGRHVTPTEALGIGVSLAGSGEPATKDLGRCWMWLSASMGHPPAALALARELVGAIREGIVDDAGCMALVDSWLAEANRSSGTLRADRTPASPRSDRDEHDEWDDDGRDRDDHGEGAVVAPRLGDPDSVPGKELAKRYHGLVGRMLPFRGEMPDPAWLETRFAAKYPWAEGLGRYVRGQLSLVASAGGGHVRLPPLLLVGPRGCGKTTMLEDLAAWCGLPALTVSVGGTHDSAGIAAIPRGWVTAQVCAPLQFINDTQCPNPAVILDELEKGVPEEAGRNGSVTAALLSMLQPPAGGYRDPCLLAEVDLGWVSWMASANSLAPLPPHLRDRFLIHRVPAPSPEHFEGILGGVFANEARRLRMQPEFLPHLGRDERAWLKAAFVRSGCSIRQLEQANRIVMGERASEEASLMLRPH